MGFQTRIPRNKVRLAIKTISKIIHVLIPVILLCYKIICYYCFLKNTYGFLSLSIYSNSISLFATKWSYCFFSLDLSLIPDLPMIPFERSEDIHSSVQQNDTTTTLCLLWQWVFHFLASKRRMVPAWLRIVFIR